MAKNWLEPFIKASSLRSQEELADMLDVSRATINRLANDHSKLKKERAAEMAPLLGASVDALMLNRPPKISIVSSFDPDADEIEGNDPPAYSREHWRPSVKGAIPEIDSKLGAGPGTVSGEVINIPVGRSGAVSGHPVLAEWMLPEAFLRHELKVQVNQSLIQEVIGDSMVPTYQPGDRVIIDLTQNRLVADTVYAISDGDSEPQIKRLQKVPFSDPVEVLIISDNPALKEFRVELSRLTIIGRVCGVVSRK